MQLGCRHDDPAPRSTAYGCVSIFTPAAPSLRPKFHATKLGAKYARLGAKVLCSALTLRCVVTPLSISTGPLLSPLLLIICSLWETCCCGLLLRYQCFHSRFSDGLMIAMVLGADIENETESVSSSLLVSAFWRVPKVRMAGSMRKAMSPSTLSKITTSFIRSASSELCNSV